jgi:hypothetical protein
MKSSQEILNTVLVDDSLNAVVSSQQALNVVYDADNSALRVTGISGGEGEPEILEYENAAAFPETGESEKIYIAIDTNSMYRWDGADYAGMSGGVALGETETTAYRGDRGKTAYDHSQTAHAPAAAEQNVNADWNSVTGDSEILNKPSSFTPATHAASHTNGTDDIQSATSSQKGLMTAEQAEKLDTLKSLWQTVTAFTATPASTSTLTMTSDLTATINPGVGLKYTIGGSDYYGICTAITDSLLTVAGAPLSGDVTVLAWTHITCIEEEFYFKDLYFADSSDSALIKTDFDFPVSWTWKRNPAFLIAFYQSTKNDDSGATTQPTIMPTIAGNDVLSSALTIPDGAENNSEVLINPTYYRINRGDILELSVTAATGGTPANDSYSLLARFLFVMEVL